jgi:guanosine-3',5'-bis(diphosphate) 3'-pyrophosphohydrolase
MIRINDIIDRIGRYNPEADLDLIDRAYIYSARVHDGQVRLSGEPYLSHPLEVAGILADMRLDAVSVAAGLLHDVIEDTHTERGDRTTLRPRSGPHRVRGHQDQRTAFGSAQARQAESIRKMILAMADDIRVISSSWRTGCTTCAPCNTTPKRPSRSRIAQETNDIYAPIAARLGIYWMKKELEDIAFMYTNPRRIRRIKSWWPNQEEREKYIARSSRLISEKMAERRRPRLRGHGALQALLQHPPENAPRTCASRMSTTSSPFASSWKRSPVLRGPGPHPRHVEAHRHQVQGLHRPTQAQHVPVAAHHRHRPGRRADRNPDPHPRDGPGGQKPASPRTGATRRAGSRRKGPGTFAWIQNLVENQENIQESQRNFWKMCASTCSRTKCYVFTPNGEIKTVPKGATPVDFAYLIHTEVGNQCTGAKVNGRMVPLRYELQTGDIVEIITTKGHHPSKDWLNFVKTVKARSGSGSGSRPRKRAQPHPGPGDVRKGVSQVQAQFQRLIKSDRWTRWWPISASRPSTI